MTVPQSCSLGMLGQASSKETLRHNMQFAVYRGQTAHASRLVPLLQSIGPHMLATAAIVNSTHSGSRPVSQPNWDEDNLNRGPSEIQQISALTDDTEYFQALEALQQLVLLPSNSSTPFGSSELSSTSLPTTEQEDIGVYIATIRQQFSRLCEETTPERALPLLWGAVKAQTSPEVTSLVVDIIQHIVSSTTASADTTSKTNTKTRITGQWLVSCLEAMVKLSIDDAEVIRSVLAALEPEVKHLKPQTVVRLLVCLSEASLDKQQKHQQPHTGVVSAIIKQLESPSFLSTLRPLQLSQTVIAMAKLDYAPSPLAVATITTSCLAMQANLSPLAVSSLLWMLARRGQASDELVEAFATQIVRRIHEYSPSCLADISRACAKKNIAPPELFAAMATRAAACVDSATPQELLRIVTSYQQLGIEPVALLEAVEAWADRRLASHTPTALSWAVWSFARMGNLSPRLLETAATCACSKATEFARVDLARLIWAFASLQYSPGQEILQHAVKELRDSAHLFGGKGSANMLWALATLKHPISTSELDGIAELLQPHITKYNPHSASNVAWAFATFGHRPANSFLTLLGRAVANKAFQAEPQAMSVTAWALATMRFEDRRLLQAVRVQCMQHHRLVDFEGQHVANFLWAMAKMGVQVESFDDREFIEALSREAAARANQLRSQEIFNTLWALATLKFSPTQEVLQILCNEAAERAYAFNSQELSGTLWALARLHCPKPLALPLLNAVEGELLVRASSFEPRHLAITVWSASHYNYEFTAAARSVLVTALKEAAGSLNAHSLNCCLEGTLQWPKTEDMKMLLRSFASRSTSLADKARPPEFASICAHLALHGLQPAAKALLSDAHNRKPVNQLETVATSAPITSLILLAFAMTSCDYHPNKEWSIIVTRLKKMSPRYRVPENRLALLHFVLTYGEQGVELKDGLAHLGDKAEKAYYKLRIHV